MIASLILFVLAVAVVYLLTAPFYIEVDSQQEKYQIRFHKLACARIFVSDSFYVDLQITGWHKTIDLLQTKKQNKPKEKSAAKSKRRISIIKVIAILKSFKISKCCVSLDTGDRAMNGILYPWFLWLASLTHKEIRINFTNQNELTLEVHNNFFRVLRAYISS